MRDLFSFESDLGEEEEELLDLRFDRFFRSELRDRPFLNLINALLKNNNNSQWDEES